MTGRLLSVFLLLLIWWVLGCLLAPAVGAWLRSSRRSAEMSPALHVLPETAAASDIPPLVAALTSLPTQRRVS